MVAEGEPGEVGGPVAGGDVGAGGVGAGGGGGRVGGGGNDVFGVDVDDIVVVCDISDVAGGRVIFLWKRVTLG